MKIKTAEATELQLDWLVATAEGFEVAVAASGHIVICRNGVADYFDPAGNWGWGGPIIEREHIYLCPASPYWGADIYDDDGLVAHRLGPTPLIAAMRCYVTSKLGDEVEIPDELG